MASILFNKVKDFCRASGQRTNENFGKVFVEQHKAGQGGFSGSLDKYSLSVGRGHGVRVDVVEWNDAAKLVRLWKSGPPRRVGHDLALFYR